MLFASQLVDQLTLAKSYVVIAKERGNLKLASEFSAQIRTGQRLLSQAASFRKSHQEREEEIVEGEFHQIVTKLSRLIFTAQDLHYDISTAIVTLRKHVEALEYRLGAAAVQSAEFGQLAVRSVPRYLHCFHLKLTSASVATREDKKKPAALVDNKLYHFCIFSDNVLATSVVVNSTVFNADHPDRFVFHVVTDGATYPAMRVWFLTNDFHGCTVEIRSVDELSSSWLTAEYSPVMRRIQEGRSEWRSSDLLNHLRFYIPEIVPALDKVVFLDDDVVVQKDLTPLFSLDLHGRANGAVETCLETFHRYHNYLNFSNPIISGSFDPQACAWAFGMNVFDLRSWKKADITAKYHHWQEAQNGNSGGFWATESSTLAPGLLAFYGSTEAIDRRWHVVGLGYKLSMDERAIENGGVVHFSGNMKPWMTKIRIAKFRHLWSRYVNSTHPYLRDCSMH